MKGNSRRTANEQKLNGESLKEIGRPHLLPLPRFLRQRLLKSLSFAKATKLLGETYRFVYVRATTMRK